MHYFICEYLGNVAFEGAKRTEFQRGPQCDPFLLEAL